MKPAEAEIVHRRRDLRKTQTDAERALWQTLCDRQLLGAKFRRQETVGPFILDFYCREAGLAVEVDGDQHAEPNRAARDERRTAYLSARGVRILRFSNMDVLTRRDQVLQAILGSLTLALARPHGRGEQTGALHD